MRSGFRSYGIAIVIVGVVAGFIVRANRQERRFAGETSRPVESSAPTLSREGLQRTIERQRAELDRNPTNARAAVSLADALLRQARVSGNAGLALEAERALKRVLHDEPLEYEARRMLGAVYLSQHRFREAILEAERARNQRPTDDWNYGVMGDGHLEIGEYDEAFKAFKRMMDLRPTAGAYARAAYALELQGKLEAALRAMQLSTDATPPNDLESLAWHHAQLGDLHRQLGHKDEAAFEFAWADHTFPGHPFAAIGMARMKEATGDRLGALRAYEAIMSRAPSPDVAERLGDLHRMLGQTDAAAREYALAEAGWRVDAPQPAVLARFLAEHDRSLEEAVRLAESAAVDRHDIFTDDALAWAYYKAGRVQDAGAAIRRALRTGSKDQTIRRHAAVIESAQRGE
ncbi:MAG TPA: tetratricopeptide repeat protein [Vicinamibacterales bacterium]|nr:tetratricopeptide repeat protein [Vicinamibacterales bacterium]